MKKSLITKLAVVTSVILLGASAQAQTLMYQWNFDGGSGTTVTPNVATGGGGGLTLGGTGVYGGAGSGVSGAAGDLAFANTGTTYGTATGAGIAASTTADINLGTLTAFTMTGWMKANGGFTAINGGGGATTTFQRVFMIGAGTPDTGSANSATLSLFNNFPSAAAQTNAIQLKLAGATLYNGPSGTDGALSGNGSLNAFGSDWTFFAVTVDLTATANNVNFYLGNASSLNAPITVTYTNNVGAAIGSIAFGTADGVALLNRANENRGLNGSGDDFRFYSGALNAAGVSAVYSSANAVPEPVTMTMLGLGSLVGIMALRRRHR